MEGGGAGKGLDGQMILTGKETSENGAAKSIPPCCLKARASAPELEAKCLCFWMVPTSSFIITIPCGLHFSLEGEAHSLNVEKILYKGRSENQKILVFESSR